MAGAAGNAAGRVEAVVIGASAGGLAIIKDLLHSLSGPPAVPVVICLHIGAEPAYPLPAALQAATRTPVGDAQDKMPLIPSRIHTAPAGYHLLIEADHSFALSVAPPVHYARPSIDILFESAAEAYRGGLAAVLLSGASHDGAAGLARVCALGGAGFVQAPETAEHVRMPEAGLAASAAVRARTPAELCAYLNVLSRPAPARPAAEGAARI